MLLTSKNHPKLDSHLRRSYQLRCLQFTTKPQNSQSITNLSYRTTRTGIVCVSIDTQATRKLHAQKKFDIMCAFLENGCVHVSGKSSRCLSFTHGTLEIAGITMGSHVIHVHVSQVAILPKEFCLD